MHRQASALQRRDADVHEVMGVKIPCRRCLIEGLDEAEVTAKLAEYIDAIEPDKRTPDELYRRRLAVCETCPQLSGGMCRQCGCFVLYRAAKTASDCPDIPDRWN